MIEGSDIKIFCGNSNEGLAKEIAECLGLPMGLCEVGRFSDGEISINIGETVRGRDVFVVQSTCPPVNDSLMEMLILIDALKRASAGRIVAVMPYYGYARQDRKAVARDPIAAKLVADLLTVAGAHSVLTMDLHARQIQGFFNIPVDHLMGVPVLSRHYKERHFEGDDLVVVSPDLGSVARARNFAKKLDAPLAIIDKRRPKPNKAEVMNIIGEVKDKRTIVIDDLIDTGGTFINGAAALMDHGAKEVYACATHGVLSGGCVEKLAQSDIKELVITNTIPLPPQNAHPMIRVLSVAGVFSKAILNIYEEKTMSSLMD